MTRIFGNLFHGTIARKMPATASSGHRCPGVFKGGPHFSVLLALVLGGCTLIPPAAPDLTKYYVLTSPTTLPASHRSSSAVRLGLRPLELPGYLRSTKSMVIRAGANEIRYQDYARWAEPLDVGLIRLLGDGLRRSEAVASVEHPPYAAETVPKYEITLRISLCEGAIPTDGPGDARLVASYKVIASDDRRVVVEKTFTAPAKNWDGKDYSALARLLSENAIALGEEIAASLPK